MAKKKPEIKEELQKRKKTSLKDIDFICPCHFVDWFFFEENVKSWIEELPAKRVIVGCNNPNEQYFENIKKFLLQFDKVEFIDQRGMKTLGMQIVDLMKRCDTEWFIYCHADARVTRHSFLVLEAEIDTKDENDNRPVGIIESERVSYDYKLTKDYPRVYSHYHYRDRSFSGYQLIRKEAIKNILDKIEDDYVYRNEDFIFQNVCENNGFRYVKSWGMHIHTSSSVNHQWTPQGKETGDARAITFDMQIKGLVKYCIPTEITKIAWRDGFGQCIREGLFETTKDLLEFIEGFVRKENPEWENVINEIFFDLIKGVYR
jgi:hypothetical protein